MDATPSPIYSPAPAPTTPPTAALAILKVVPVPQPRPTYLDVDLQTACDRLELKIYSAAFVEAASVLYPVTAAGWTRLPLSQGIRGLPSGLYFARVTAIKGVAVATATARLLLLR